MKVASWSNLPRVCVRTCIFTRARMYVFACVYVWDEGGCARTRRTFM